MRLRLPELLEERKVTVYRIAQDTDGDIDQSALYRIVRKRGVGRYLDTELADKLCAYFGIGPGELLEQEGKSAKAPATKRTRRPR